MSIGGRTFRAFRPSRFGRQDEVEEEVQQTKVARISIYAKRVEAGLPLFDQPSAAKAIKGPRNLAV